MKHCEYFIPLLGYMQHKVTLQVIELKVLLSCPSLYYFLSSVMKTLISQLTNCLNSQEEEDEERDFK